MKGIIGSLLALLVIIFMAACQPAVKTSGPAASATNTAIQPTFTYTNTPTPTTSPTPLPTHTPTATRLLPSPTPSATPTPLFRGTPVFDNLNVLRRFDTQQDWVILTIDDGLSKAAAIEMLDLLKAANVHATFFLAGKCACSNLGAEIMQRMASEGHEIAYHSMNHDDLETLKKWTVAQWEVDLVAWQDNLRAVLGDELYTRSVRPFARAPYGMFSKTFLEMCSNKNLLPVSWSCDPLCVDGTLALPAGRILIYHVRGDQVASLKQLLNLGRTVLPLGEVISPIP